MDAPIPSVASTASRSRRSGLMALIALTVVVLDQLTKWLVTGSMRLHESIPVIPDLFSLTYIRNSGAAFGILAGSHAGFRLVFFGLTSVLALALLGTIYARLSPADWVGQVSVASIFGGAVGNLIDRIRAGEVIDFLDFSLWGHHWPAFNVADAAITVGVCFLIVHFFQQKPEGPT
ncbi:MAG: signal peptidase II [Nitrospirae bacterium]|nr:MAG: signal peptidase II [Nitrospirota bacterium]